MFMQIETTRFGALDIEERKVIQFPDGLPGFEDRRLFTLVPHHTADGGKGSPFVWLQSLEDGGAGVSGDGTASGLPRLMPRASLARIWKACP